MFKVFQTYRCFSYSPAAAAGAAAAAPAVTASVASPWSPLLLLLLPTLFYDLQLPGSGRPVVRRADMTYGKRAKTLFLYSMFHAIFGGHHQHRRR